MDMMTSPKRLYVGSEEEKIERDEVETNEKNREKGALAKGRS